MALARWQATITDAAGNVLPGASVEVRREDTGGLIALYSDRAGAVVLGNPFQADERGYAFFHAPGGAYRITATLGNQERIWRYVALGLAGEVDSFLLALPSGDWSAESTYGVGEYVYHGGYIYISMVPGNDGNEPDDDTPGSTEEWMYAGVALEGPSGWSAVYATVVDSSVAPSRRVRQLVDWVGGSGEKPGGIGQYEGGDGLVVEISDATDIRGAPGPSGDGSGDMLVSLYDPTAKEADAFDSANHTFDNTGTGLSSENTQDAIAEIDAAAVRYRFKTVSDLVASTQAGGGTGTRWQAGPYLYDEAASGASDHHVETAGGVKLYVLPDGEGKANIMAFGARGGARTYYPNATIGSGSNALTVSTGSFTNADIGKVILINKAGPDGVPLVTTITGVNSTTSITLEDTASSALSATFTNITYGYDDTEPFQKCAAAFLEWSLPADSFIVSDTSVLHATAKVFGVSRFLTHLYRIADEPIFQAVNAGTGRTQGLDFGKMHLYGRGASDTSTIFDGRGLSYADFDDIRIIGDPIGSGAVSTANCIGLDLTYGGASFNGYIKLKDVFALYCDIGLDANVNQFEIEGGFLNANRTWGGIIRGAGLFITNTEISSNGRGQVAQYVGDYPDGHYDRGGLLLDNLSGYTIKGVWHEQNANRIDGLFSRNDIDITSSCRRGFIEGDRRDWGGNTRIHGLGRDTGSYNGDALSPQIAGLSNLVANGRMERLLASGAPASWSDAGTITTDAASLLPIGVTGKKLTGSSGVPRRYQQLIAPGDIPKYIGRKITTTFWLAIHDEDWTGGAVRAGLSLNGAGSFSNGVFVQLAGTVPSAGTPSRMTLTYVVDGTESNGVNFVVQFYRTSGPWSVELGDVSAAIGDVVPAQFERPITTGNYLAGQATWNPPSLAAGASAIGSPITVPGAALGDFVMTSFSVNADGCDFSGHVSAADTVTPIVTNKNADTKDLGSGTVRVWVMKL